MNPTTTTRSRQPVRVPWTYERLVRERAIALGQAIDNTTWKTYGSALNSYLNFIRLHDIPLEPTADTLSLFTVYMSHHINPKSVNSYLSGIVQQLEPFFPNVRTSRNSTLVSRTLQGCLRARGRATKRKRALTLDDLESVITHYQTSLLHDDLLFVSMLLTGFFALMRLGELTYPNDPSLHDFRKVTKRSSVVISADQYSFHLPSHKADRFFEGNKIIVTKNQFRLDPLLHFQVYLTSRDKLLPYSSPLWLTNDGNVPTRSFFINRLRIFFQSDIGGQSMRAGGATSLAENGTPPSLIQAMGRWASSAFQIYVRKNPVFIHALLLGRTNRPFYQHSESTT